MTVESLILKDMVEKLPTYAVSTKRLGIETWAWPLSEDVFAFLGLGPAGPTAGVVTSDEVTESTISSSDEIPPFKLMVDMAATKGLFARRFELSDVVYAAADCPKAAVKPDGKFADFVSRFLVRVDGEAIDLLGRHGRTWSRGEYEWLTQAIPHPQRRRRIANLWPWATEFLMRADFLGMADPGESEDAIKVADCVVRVLAATGRRVRPQVVALAMHPRACVAMCGVPPSRVLESVSALPPEWLPEYPGDGRKAEIFRAEFASLAAVAPLIKDFAIATRREPSKCVSMDGEGWAGLVARLAERIGIVLGEDVDVPPTMIVANFVAAANDMIAGCSNHLIQTAADLVDPTSKPLRDVPMLRLSGRLCETDWEQGDMVQAFTAFESAALRLLAGTKTIGGLAELIGKWHANLSPIMEVAAEVAGDEELERAFQPWTSRGGIEFSCVGSAAQLAVEGREMKNCVSIYLADCMGGYCSIVSIRKGGQRLATGEFTRTGFEQITGPGNTPPPAEVTAAAKEFEAAVRSREVAINPDAVTGDRAGAVVPFLDGYAERFSDFVAAWSPFLGRDVRGLDARAILEASGYDPRKHVASIKSVFRSMGIDPPVRQVPAAP